MDREEHAAMKQRAVREFKLYWIFVFYLWLVLGSFTVYRRLVTAEGGSAYLNYGIAIIEALVIAKVILIGRMFAFSRNFEDKPLIVPVLYKSILFGVLVLLFGVVEHLVEGWVRGQGLLGGLRAIGAIGGYELAARSLLLVVTFVAFFAFGEIGRVIGADRLSAMFFRTRDTPNPTEEATKAEPDAAPRATN